MRIKHEDAVVLEAIVRRTFNCERGGMGGFVDADHFEISFGNSCKVKSSRISYVPATMTH